jgi:CheY-like chemotaxis protein
MSKKILIADQSGTVREIAENLLRKKGFEVISASDGVEALELLQTAGADLAFINSALPEIDGYSISKQIKSKDRTRQIKTVLLLSTSEIVNQSQLLSSMADSTLNKPFSPQDLVEKAFEALDLDLKDAGGIESEENDIAESVISAQELDLTDEVHEEIDFGSVFSDEEPKDDSGEETVDEIFLTEDNPDHATDQVMDIADASTEVKDEIDHSDAAELPAGPEAGESGVIRLSDDQYGLEGPLEESEVGNPHDYSWFIREMKKDLGSDPSSASQDGAAKPSSSESGTDKIKAVPGVPKSGPTTGTLHIEESGTSRVYLPDLALDVDARKESNPEPDNAVTAEPMKESERLSLAERLLIKEVARRLADKMLDKFTSNDLREIIAEVLTSLKKM